MEIIRYEGNSKYIIILYKEDDKLFVFYARTGELSLNDEVEDNVLDRCEDIRTRFIVRHNCTINIPLLQRGNKVFSIIQVDSEKAYDLIKTVVEDLL